MPVRTLPLLFIALFLVSSACDSNLQGDFSENQPPRTFLTVDHIEPPADDEDRMPSRVDITWWGDDPDGYVVAYEICIGEQDTTCHPQEGEWEYTESTDTTLVLPLPPGDDIADILFNVRAIDNEDLRDPEGASIRFPIKNTPPSIRFDPTFTPPDTTYSIMSFGWTATDPDGDQDLHFIEVALNIDEEEPDESDWLRLERDETFLTLMINQDEPDGNGNVTADVFLGRAMRSFDQQLHNVRLNGENTLYIRAFDQSLDESNIASHEWYVKEQTSNILFVNDDVTGGAAGSIRFHTRILDDLGFDYDLWDISDALIPSGNVLPTPFDPTLPLVMAQWDHIYFISNQLDHNLLYALQLTSEFINRGGSIFVNIESRQVASHSRDAVFNFLPFTGFQELPPGESRFLLFPGSPVEALSDELPDLTLSAGSQNTFPLIPEGDANRLYNADFRVSGDHEFSRLIAASNQDRNILFLGIDLQDLTEDSPILETMEYFLIDHLGFEMN